MIWFLVSLIGPLDPNSTETDRLVMVSYETEDQCQRALADRMLERRDFQSTPKLLVKWETCVSEKNVTSL